MQLAKVLSPEERSGILAALMAHYQLQGDTGAGKDGSEFCARARVCVQVCTRLCVYVHVYTRVCVINCVRMCYIWQS